MFRYLTVLSNNSCKLGNYHRNFSSFYSRKLSFFMSGLP